MIQTKTEPKLLAMSAVDAAYQNNFSAVKDLLASYKAQSEAAPSTYKFQNYIEARGVNQRDPFGDTVLHAAATTGNLLLVRYLVGEGADVNAVNHVRNFNHKQSQTFNQWVRSLPNSPQLSTQSINNMLIMLSSVLICPFLQAGSTPLHKACAGHAAPNTALAVVKFLIQSGANPLVKNKLGMLAEDYARFDPTLATALMGTPNAK